MTVSLNGSVIKVIVGINQFYARDRFFSPGRKEKLSNLILFLWPGMI